MSIKSHIPEGQVGPRFDALEKLWARRRTSESPSEAILARRPAREALRPTLEQLTKFVEGQTKAIVLDSGCGTGESTNALALRYPDQIVLGLDKSELRLSKKELTIANAHHERMDLIDFWILAANKGWKFSKHYILYPNPWPKAAHLSRRWHGHSIFPALLGCSDVLELRTNWEIYALEFQFALELFGFSSELVRFEANEPITAFERKYQKSEHPLWRLTAKRNPS